MASHWGRSSAGRAPALHAGGQEFDPPRLHHLSSFLLRRRNGGGNRSLTIQRHVAALLFNAITTRVAACRKAGGKVDASWCSAQAPRSGLRVGHPRGVRSVAPATNCVTKIQPNRPFHEQAVSVPNPRLAAGAAVAGRMKHALDYMVKHESASGGCLGSQRR